MTWIKHLIIFLYGLFITPVLYFLLLITIFSGCIHCSPTFTPSGTVIFTAFIFAISAVYISYKHGWKPILLATLALGMIISLWWTYATAVRSWKNYRISSATRRVIPDLKQLQLSLELYLDEYGRYPELDEGCQDVTVLDKFLAPDFIAGIPIAVKNEVNKEEYKIAISSSGNEYVLSGNLIDINIYVLKEDIDGNILGCDCNDPVYCIVPL